MAATTIPGARRALRSTSRGFDHITFDPSKRLRRRRREIEAQSISAFARTWSAVAIGIAAAAAEVERKLAER